MEQVTSSIPTSFHRAEHKPKPNQNEPAGSGSTQSAAQGLSRRPYLFASCLLIYLCKRTPQAKQGLNSLFIGPVTLFRAPAEIHLTRMRAPGQRRP